jgi:hypothetical protein
LNELFSRSERLSIEREAGRRAAIWHQWHLYKSHQKLKSEFVANS